MKYTIWSTTIGMYPMKKVESELDLSEALRRMADMVDSPQVGEFHVRDGTDDSVFEMFVKKSEVWTTLPNGAKVLGYQFTVETWNPAVSMMCPGPHCG